MLTARKRAHPIDADRYVGTRIRERRITVGMTQTDLAAQLGLSYQQICKYEKGTNRVSAGRLLQLAQVLGCEVGYFFDGFTGMAAPIGNLPSQSFIEMAQDYAKLPPQLQAAVGVLVRKLRPDAEIASLDEARRARGVTP